jgi:hypothetical protein
MITVNTLEKTVLTACATDGKMAASPRWQMLFGANLRPSRLSRINNLDFADLRNLQICKL